MQCGFGQHGWSGLQWGQLVLASGKAQVELRGLPPVTGSPGGHLPGVVSGVSAGRVPAVGLVVPTVTGGPPEGRLDWVLAWPARLGHMPRLHLARQGGGGLIVDG